MPDELCYPSDTVLDHERTTTLRVRMTGFERGVVEELCDRARLVVDVVLVELGGPRRIHTYEIVHLVSDHERLVGLTDYYLASGPACIT